MQPDVNAVYTYIAPEPDNQNNPQLRQAIAIPAGNRATVQIGLFATNRPFAGELELVGVNLPPGVTVRAPKITQGMTRVPVVFEASEDAKPAASLVELIVRPVNGTKLTSGYRQTILMNAYGNNDYYLHVLVERLAIAVTEPAQFSVKVEEPKSALVQNGEMTLKFTVQRAKDYDGPVTVLLEGEAERHQHRHAGYSTRRQDRRRLLAQRGSQRYRRHASNCADSSQRRTDSPRPQRRRKPYLYRLAAVQT